MTSITPGDVVRFTDAYLGQAIVSPDVLEDLTKRRGKVISVPTADSRHPWIAVLWDNQDVLTEAPQLHWMDSLECAV